MLHIYCLWGQQTLLLSCTHSGVTLPLFAQGGTRAKIGLLVPARTGPQSTPIVVCGHGLESCAWCYGGTSRLGGGWHLAPDQWFWKCFPTPARTRKLETYGYQELCLSCGESAYLTSYSNLRMALPTLCVREPFTAFEALAGPAEARKVIFVVCVARSCACRGSDCFFDAAVQLSAALPDLLRRLCCTRLHSLFSTGTKEEDSIATVFVRQHPPVLQQFCKSMCQVCSAAHFLLVRLLCQAPALVKV